MVDYVKLAATAKRLISENGRDIVFVNKNKILTDANKPWKGSTSTGDTKTTFKCVMAPPNTVRLFGLPSLGEGTEYRDMIKFSEQILILFPGTTDMRTFTHTEDGGVRWTINAAQVLQPATIQLLAFIGVRR